LARNTAEFLLGARLPPSFLAVRERERSSI
jgi:hypothetical protein